MSVGECKSIPSTSCNCLQDWTERFATFWDSLHFFDFWMPMCDFFCPVGRKSGTFLRLSAKINLWDFEMNLIEIWWWYVHCATSKCTDSWPRNVGLSRCSRRGWKSGDERENKCNGGHEWRTRAALWDVSCSGVVGNKVGLRWVCNICENVNFY